jgi:cytochrome c553
VSRLRSALLAAVGFLVSLLALRSPQRTGRQPGAAPAGEPAGREEKRGKARGRREEWKSFFRKLAVLALLLGAGGFLVVASGIVPIKASSGHSPITVWFLSFSMKRSTATYSLGVQAPPLDDPALIVKGAGHFETGCAPCHGSPTVPHPRIPQAMAPYPPYLSKEIPRWRDEELFTLVKHGVKLTGMPAWPSQKRDDEVWAVVAFLRVLPELDAAEYRRLARGEVPPDGEAAPLQALGGSGEAPRGVLESCARCHGLEGLGRGRGAFPRLAGQSPSYLYAALRAYARGDRHSGMMEPVAAGLTLDQMRKLALYYGGRRPPAPLPAPRATSRTGSIERGREIAHRGVPSRRVPACAECHGPGTGRRNPLYPRLAGQSADYLVLQLGLFQQGNRGGSAYAHLMRPVASRLTPEDMRAVAAYYDSLD